MPFATSPKALAKDIADGFFDLTPLILKKYTSAEIKTINVNIHLLLREIRGEGVPSEDIPAIRQRNLRIQRLNQALLVLNTYCRKHRIPL